jgi:hypothetical protein
MVPRGLLEKCAAPTMRFDARIARAHGLLRIQTNADEPVVASAGPGQQAFALAEDS